MAAEIISGMVLVMKQHTTFHPGDVTFFGTDIHVLEAKDLLHLIEQFALGFHKPSHLCFSSPCDMPLRCAEALGAGGQIC
jgi:hypothetical protein